MRRDIGRDIRREGKKAALLFFLLAFLSGCGREESRISVGSVGESAEKVSVDEQKPLLVIPSSAEWIDLVFVSEGMYCIFDGDQYGFSSEDGRKITPCIYDIANPFSEGLACVSKEGKYGYIDVEGETAIPFVYDRATPFVEGLAYFVAGDTYGFMDKTGKTAFCLECDSVSSFQEGLAYFSIDGRYGYIDQKGQVVIEPVYDDAGYFKDGLATVMKDGRYGMIDREGTCIVAAEYDAITAEDTFIIAQSDGVYTCFDKKGKTLLEHADYITALGKYICFQQDEKQGLLDGSGGILLEPLYDQISLLVPEENLFCIQENGLYGVVDLQGEVTIDATYDYICYDKYADDKKGGMLVFEKADGSMECADVSALSDPSRRISCHYDSIHWLDEERAVVGQNGLFGIMDREGNLTEPITYDIIQGFDSGAFWRKKGSNAWFHNSMGKVTALKDNITVVSQKGNYYQIEKNGKYGFMNEQGEEAIPPVYSYISNQEVYGFPDDIFVLKNYNSSNYSFIIKTGESEQRDNRGALLRNEITPRIGLYHEFTQSGSIRVDEYTADGCDVTPDDMRDCRKIYKLYDLDHTGEPVLYVKAAPYANSGFPMSYSGFYAIEDMQLAELITGYECGGSMRGDYACLWYDRETSRVLPGTKGFWGGFGGYSSSGIVYDRSDAEMTHAASFGWVYQPISYFSKEELAHADMVYDADDRPYKKEMTGQTEKESVRIYYVNGEQVASSKVFILWENGVVNGVLDG